MYTTRSPATHFEAATGDALRAGAAAAATLVANTALGEVAVVVVVVVAEACVCVVAVRVASLVLKEELPPLVVGGIVCER